MWWKVSLPKTMPDISNYVHDDETGEEDDNESSKNEDQITVPFLSIVSISINRFRNPEEILFKRWVIRRFT